MRLEIRFACLLLVAATSAEAADLPAAARPSARRDSGGGARIVETCPLWQPPYGIRVVPTNDWCDPTYVGSSMGLSRPSYYGTLPRPGFDAP
jgi:hypothetical protein